MYTKFKKNLLKRIYVNTNYRIDNTILIAGTGRSGTTWISDIVNYNNRYRDIFEPFNNIYTKEYSAFEYKKYMRPEDNDQAFYDVIHRILSGKIYNKWVNQYNQKAICNRRIIKDIRINLFLKWLRNNFPDLKIVFILRHPCAVAASRLKLGWSTHLKEICSQSILIDDHFSDIYEHIINVSDNFEKQIYLWCIENYVALTQLNEDDAIILFYENMCLNPVGETKRLFSELRLEYSDDVLAKIRKPSVVTERHSAIVNNENLIDNWKRTIDRRQTLKAIEILEYFGLDKIYGKDSEPKVGRLKIPFLS